MFAVARWILDKLLWLAQFLPGNLLRKWLCSPRGYKYALPATLLVVPYAAFGYWLYLQIQAGAAHPVFLLVVLGCAVSIWHYLVLGLWAFIAEVEARITLAKETRGREAARWLAVARLYVEGAELDTSRSK